MFVVGFLALREPACSKEGSMQNSKLGVHNNFITEADAMKDFVQRAQPAVVKVLNPGDVDYPTHVKLTSPETAIIFRRYFDKQPLNNPVENARDAAAKILGSSVVRFRLADYVEGYNEIGPHPTADYMKFELELARILHNEGVKYLAGSWSVGCPDLPDWKSEWILQVLRVADGISVHEYCAPELLDPRGLDPNEPGTGFFTLRYRKWYPELPMDCKKPLFLTEIGIDSGAAHWPVPGQGGWRSFTDAEGYLRQLIRYDSELRKDHYVDSAAIFCWGTLDPTWATFDLSGLAAELLEDYLVSQQTETAEPDVNRFVGDRMQAHLIPANPEAAFQKYAWAYSLGSARSREIELTYKGRPILAQVYMRDWDLSRQFVVCAYLDDPRPWDLKIWRFERSN